MTTATHPATFTSAEVCRQAGITNRQLRHWTERDYLRPQQHIRGFPKPGSQRPGGFDFEWPQAELEVARMMARLVALGVTAQQAAKVARDPQQRWRWLADVIAVTKGMP
jgi:hypothetical protein